MEIKPTPDGWKEITTKYIVVKKILKRNYFEAKNWVETNERAGFKGWDGSKQCQRCKATWESLSHPTGGVHLILTNYGNMVICDKCLDLIVVSPQADSVE